VIGKARLILGAGGHAKVLLEALQQAGVAIMGVVDSDPALLGTKILGIPVLGDDTKVGQFSCDEIVLVNGLGSIRLPVRRTQIFKYFKEQGYCFATVVHPSAIIASDVVLGEGTQVMAGAVIQPGCRIGCNSIVNTRASIDHDCLIGDHVHIAPGVTMSGAVRVGDGAHIGTGATIIQGITVGQFSTVGAGAVVTKNVKDGRLVVGVPARERLQ